MEFVDQYLHRPLLLLRLALRVRFICGSWGIIRYFRCDSSRISWLFRRGREVGLARPNLWLCGREELCGGRAPCQRRPRPPPPPRPMDLIRFDPCPQQQRRVVPNETTMGGKAKGFECRAMAVQPFRWKVRYREQAARARRGLSWLASIHRLVLPLQVASRNRPNVHHGVRRCRSLDWGAGYIHPDGRRATTRSNGQLTMCSR